MLCGCFCYHRYRGVIQEDGPLRCEGLFEDTFLTQRLLKENRLAISQFLCLRLMCQTINRDGEYIYNAAVIAKLFCLCISVFSPPLFTGHQTTYMIQSESPFLWEDFDRNFPAVVEELWEGIQHFILSHLKEEREKDRKEDRKRELRNSEGCIIQHAWK